MYYTSKQDLRSRLLQFLKFMLKKTVMRSVTLLVCVPYLAVLSAHDIKFWWSASSGA